MISPINLQPGNLFLVTKSINNVYSESYFEGLFQVPFKKNDILCFLRKDSARIYFLYQKMIVYTYNFSIYQPELFLSLKPLC